MGSRTALRTTTLLAAVAVALGCALHGGPSAPVDTSLAAAEGHTVSHARITDQGARRHVRKLAHRAARHKALKPGRAAAAKLQRTFPPVWRKHSVVKPGHRRHLTVRVTSHRRCITWSPGGKATIAGGRCKRVESAESSQAKSPRPDRPGRPAPEAQPQDPRSSAPSAGSPTGGSAATGQTLFGYFPGVESDVMNDTSVSFRGWYPKIAKSLGDAGVVRIYYNGIPPADFVNSSADYGIPVVLSFKGDPVKIASGAYDSRFKSFFTSIPVDRMVWWSYYHEPEDNIAAGEFTVAQYRAAWNHLETLAPERNTLRATLILMGWDIHPYSGRNVEDYLTPGLKVLAWDNYVDAAFPTVASSYDPTAKVSRAHGLGFAVAETSVWTKQFSTQPDRSTVVRDVVSRARANNAEFVTWFETHKEDGDWRLAPYTAAARLWKELTH